MIIERNCDIIQFVDACVLNLSEVCNVQIVGLNHISENTTVYVKFADISVQYLGDGFENIAVCDYAVLSDKCKTDIRNVKAKEIFAQYDYVHHRAIMNDDINLFGDRFKIEVNTEESSCRIYEP